MKNKEKMFAVIGMGRFGLSLCEALSESGADVLAIDVDEEKLKHISHITAQCVIVNCAIEDTVVEMKLDEYDVVMVSIGEDVNASILTTLNLKEQGVKQVWVKARDKQHAKILEKIGADRVIRPERDMGKRMAKCMLDRSVFDFIDLGSGLALAEVVITSKFMGKSLSSHPCYQNSSNSVLGMKKGTEIKSVLFPDMRLETGDILIVAGKKKNLTDSLNDAL